MAIATRDTPVGTTLPPLTRTVAPVVMKSRQWTGTNPVHADEELARRQGFAKPIATGQISAAYIQEMCIRFFGEAFFYNASIDVRFVRPVFMGDTLTTGGVVREKTLEGSGLRFTVDAWCQNEQREQVTVAVVHAVVA